MADKVVKFDDDDISKLGTSSPDIEINASAYSDELYSLNYIEGVFKALVNTLKDSQSTIDSARNFLKDNVDFPEQVSLPEILGISLDYSLPSSSVATSFADGYLEEKMAVQLNNTDGSLNFREAPSTKSNVIDSLKHNDEVVIIEKGDEWTLVRANDKKGYVKNEYLREIK